MGLLNVVFFLVAVVWEGRRLTLRGLWWWLWGVRGLWVWGTFADLGWRDRLGLGGESRSWADQRAYL